ncbi:MAG: molybdenum cofactor guanylyltransferase [Ilumatobacteraceae bacterium]
MIERPDDERPIAGAVLCGGASSRMGRDKSLVAVGGEAMAARVAGVLRSAGCHPVVAVGGDETGLVAAGLEVVADRYRGGGPLGGIITALGTFSESADAVVVTACDMPSLDPVTVLALCAALGDSDAAVAVADRLEPLCAVWSVLALATLEQLYAGGERAVHRALRQLHVVRVDVALGAVHNVNRPSDL